MKLGLKPKVKKGILVESKKGNFKKEPKVVVVIVI